MLRPDQEVSPGYLRTLRQTLKDVILPEVSSPAGQDAIRFSSDVLAALEGPARSIEEHQPQAFTITTEAIQAYLKSRFRDEAIRVTDSHQITGGRSKITVMLSIEPHPSLPPGIVLRFDNPGSAQDTTVLDEYPVLKAIHRNGILGPEPLWLEADPAPLGARFLAMRRMDGSVPGTFWSAGDASPALALALADVLAVMHRVHAAKVWSEAPLSARDAVAEMVAALETRWHEASGVTSITLEGAFGWAKRQIDRIDGASTVIHGDIHFANMLAESDRLICLTDWEFCHSGHPAEDLAFCRGYIETLMPWDDFMTRYLAAGGVKVTDAQLRFFAVWGLLRNATLGAGVLAGMADGAVPDLQSLYIALHARARVEAQLAQTLATELRREAHPVT